MHYKKALPFFEQLLQNNKSDSLNQLAAGEIALLSGNDKAARNHFESYAAQHDARMYAQSQVAERYAAMGYTAKAKALFEQSGTWKWSQTKTMLLMALKQNDEGTVRRIIKSAAATHSDPVALMLHVAALYFRTHSFSADLANDLARRIEKLNARHPVVELIRACALAQQGKVGPARQLLEKVLQGPGIYLVPLKGGLSRGPQYARAFALRTFAGFALRSANIELAKWALDKTLVGNPFGPAVAGALQVIQVALERDSTHWADGDKRKLCQLGLAYLKRIGMHTEWRVWAVSSESEFYLKSGDLDAAINVFEAAIKNHPSNASYRNNLAYMLARQDTELPRALTMVRLAMQLQPEENLFYLDTEGWVLFKMGRYEEALKSLQHSVRYMTETSSSSISESLYHLALCYQKLGRTFDADNALRRAVKMDPEGYYGQRAFLKLSSKTEN
jgi:tetratricopeptide (TPR) repeat protein